MRSKTRKRRPVARWENSSITDAKKTEGFSREVFEIASRQLAAQKEDLKNIRNQAAITSALTGLVAATGASALGEAGLSGHNLPPHILGMGAAVWIVFGFFFFALFFSARVLISWKACTFDHSAKFILDERIKGREPNEIYAQLATESEAFFDQNEDVIKYAHRDLTFAVFCSVALVPAWLLFIF
ncbi:hypothetical protein [Sedimentimonas flavescens]|uniref:hypothetical protein n=1 Tax=Sedimentimonas flavescens TaxID=2851012 RepID=UPI001C4A1177|nr:hypothetical protein [Sedimentimonas flavescens]MBW0157703.1 hypothetical protein [Sedimentimonas flavescens]